MGQVRFADRLRNILKINQGNLDELMDELTDSLVEGDFGAPEAYTVSEELRKACVSAHIKDGEGIREKLAEILEARLKAVRPLELDEDGFTVLLLLGVNGVGKTTTAAKLAHRSMLLGHRPLLAAADTFRAAASDQLKIHGTRLNLRVVAHKAGGDPAAVIYDAIEAALAGGADMVIADTAGRMHTKTSLVEELKKIDRIVRTKAPTARYLKLLVVDATTGRNAMAQAEIFHEALSIDAVVLTKYDSGARGGIVFSLASTLTLPVAYVCTGESYEDINVFDPHAYVNEFVGRG